MLITCSFYVDVGRPTSAKTASYLIALSTTFSVDLVMSGEYPSNNPSSSRSDERRASTYVKIIIWRRWVVAKVRTVSFAENRTSKLPLYFPIAIASALLIRSYQTG